MQTDISAMTAEQLIEAVIDSFDEDELEQIKLHALIQIRAQSLGVGKQIEKLITKYKKAADSGSTVVAPVPIMPEISLVRDYNGLPKPTIENFYAIMDKDVWYSGVRFNLLANRPEIHKDGQITAWTDADEAASKGYIESKYKIHSEGKHADALRLLFKNREYNPVQDLVDSLKWDGTNRIESFLTEWAKADDTPYVREVSRLIFAGGINRLYRPGCKFDDVPVLIGTSQGEGKSSLVMWLAMHDSFFSEVTEIEGQRAIEQLEGAWICEVAELLALTRSKEQEGVKAYVTRQRDKYRKPYDKQTIELPRRCIFVGTTNNDAFLRDKTGNRRWYPVQVHSDGYWLHDHEQECRDYIVQCWAEAKVRFDRGEMPAYADESLRQEYKTAQDNAMEDDWRVGAIQMYLDGKLMGDRVCVRQVAHEALSPDRDHPKDPTKQESTEISRILCNMKGWKKSGSTHRFAQYGIQKYWEKLPGNDVIQTELPLPFGANQLQ